MTGIPQQRYWLRQRSGLWSFLALEVADLSGAGLRIASAASRAGHAGEADSGRGARARAFLSGPKKYVPSSFARLQDFQPTAVLCRHILKYIRYVEALLMRFEWDEDKNRRNLAKHKVSFETARSVFDDPHVVSIQDRVVEGEERWQTVGMVSGTVLFVAHTYRDEAGDEVIRLISARKAIPHERRAYAKSQKRSSG